MANSAFHFTVDGKAFTVLASASLTPEEEETAKLAFIEIQKEEGMQLPVLHKAETHEFTGVKFTVCRMPDGLAELFAKDEVRRLEEMLKA